MSTHKTQRIISVIAATVVSLACGTNYAYSAWAPEFGDQLKLSSTQVNLVGTFGNLGTYSAGIPLGIMTDSKGPRPGLILGAFCLLVGYFGLYQSYRADIDAPSMALLCLFSYLSGIGGCSAFLGSIKTAASNWPNHRGTATAFPLAAYGLSAFFFTIMSHFAFAEDTAGLLLLLTIATTSMVAFGGLFLRIISGSHQYSALPNQTELNDSGSSTITTRTKSAEDRDLSQEQGTHPNGSSIDETPSKDSAQIKEPEVPEAGFEETSSLLSKSSGRNPADASDQPAGVEGGSRKLDVRGIPLLSKTEFYQIWVMVGLLTGIGLMTINNIGSDNRALWHHYDDSAPPDFIRHRQLVYVEVLSFFSFCGRLMSGVGSDFLVHRLRMSRYWCLLASSLIFLVAQICAAKIQIPNALGAVAALSGLAYGFLYGVSPTLVVEAFGIRGLSQNWGIMTIAPILFGNIFNMIYGAIYDRNSAILPNGARDCRDGLYCYRTAYLVTIGASALGVAISIWSIRHDHVRKANWGKERDMRRDA